MPVRKLLKKFGGRDEVISNPRKDINLGYVFKMGTARRGKVMAKKNQPYKVTQVFKGGEKDTTKWSTRGPKPLGYNVYIDNRFKYFISANLVQEIESEE